MKGLSPRNLIYMQTFSKIFPDLPFTQQVVAQIPWGHIILLLDKVKSVEEREWYVVKTLENGWSRNILEHQIAIDLYMRQGKAITNFKETLPLIQSDLAQQLLKSPYNVNGN